MFSHDMAQMSTIVRKPVLGFWIARRKPACTGTESGISGIETKEVLSTKQRKSKVLSQPGQKDSFIFCIYKMGVFQVTRFK